jgi:hypothetical protein
MRLHLFIVTGALGLASLLAVALGAGSASDVADYAAWGLIPVFWVARKLVKRRSSD